MKQGKNIVHELNEVQNIESDCQINDIFVNCNSTILIISKTLKKQVMVNLNLYQFKDGSMKQFQNQCHSQKGIYCTPNSNMFITQHIYDYEIILKNQSYVGLNNSKYLNQIQFYYYQLGKGITHVNLAIRNHKAFCYFPVYHGDYQLVMNDQEDICIYSYKIKIVKEFVYRKNMTCVSKSAIVFNKKQKGAWIQSQIIEENYHVQGMLFNQSTSELICSCINENQQKCFINFFKLKNESKWSVTKQLKIPNCLNTLYFLNHKTLTVFQKFDYQLIQYQLQENGWFKKFKCIQVMEIDESLKNGETNKKKGKISFSDSLQLHIVYNDTTINIIDINAEEDQVVQKRIDIVKTNSSGYSQMTQDGKYYITFIKDQNKLQVYKIYIKNK